MQQRRSADKRSMMRIVSPFAMAMAATALSGCGILNIGSSVSGGSDHDGRFYVGIGGLASKLEPDTDESNLEVDETASSGGSVAIGYDISNRFSLEGHLASLGEATLSNDEPVGYTVGGVSAIGYFLNDSEDRGRREGFSVFGRLGVGFMDNEVDDSVPWERVNNAHLMFGGGVEYGLANGLGVRAEVVSHDADAQYAQLGLVYRFGDVSSGAPAVSTAATAAAEEAEAKAAEPVEPITREPLDSDGDSVANAVDQCPGTPVGMPVDDTGCEIFGGAIEGVNFSSGSDALTASAEEVLQGVANVLTQYPNVRVSIEAHTDNQGAADSNLQLSKRRAIAVARYLVNRGIAGGRLQPRAHGESKPIASNATAEGRAQNRRVEFLVLN
ncbi:MAG: OmpA family protein [Gammaproteobacteria bacterium]|nr:OmpA family protein [Gammaproteobacteria bacterium]